MAQCGQSACIGKNKRKKTIVVACRQLPLCVDMYVIRMKFNRSRAYIMVYEIQTMFGSIGSGSLLYGMLQM